MNRLSEIPVTVEPSASREDTLLGGGVIAMLHEIAALLERLHRHGEAGAVDLATMPMATHERECLREALGEGEVDAEVRVDGVSQVRETAIHGVWWVTHRDPEGNVLAELVEITTVPMILRTDAADIANGVVRIGQRLAMQEGDRGSNAGGCEHD